jgi:DNA ligase-1
MTEPIEGSVFEFLDELNDKPGAKARDKTYLAGLASQSEYHLDLVNRILRGNLGAGFDIKTIREVDRDLIFYSPYCRCSGPERLEKISFKQPAFSQLKADGMFLNIHFGKAGEPIRYTTRKGNELDFLGVPDQRFFHFPTRAVAMGEAQVLAEDGVSFLLRAAGNAIITKALDGHISPEEAARIRFSLWDMVDAFEFADGASKVPYHMRYEALYSYTKVSDGVEMIETRLVNSIEEAWDHYAEVRAKHLEGTITKDAMAMWEDSTSLLQCKLKAVKECEVLVTGWKPGKVGGKYANCIGSLTVQSSCGKLIGDVSGMSDEDRFRDPDYFLDRVITVRFNAVSTSKKTDVRSFDHCRYVELRKDKNVADSLEYILNVKEVKR